MTTPTRLRCEYQTNPNAIDTLAPRLSWWLNDERRDVRQTSYHVLVASSPENLANDVGDLWDSGVVRSDNSTHVEYRGAPLRSRRRAFWKVRADVAAGSAEVESTAAVLQWSEPATWEMGLLSRDDWSAKWIAAPIVGGPYTIPPAAYVRKQFGVAGGVKSARLYVTALGLYECEINGQRVGDNVLPPGRTEYRKRVPYHVHDVTEHLAAGPNMIGAILGDGWYCGHIHSDPRQRSGDRPKFLAQLEIIRDDGSIETVVTDESWQANEGPIRASDMLMGEDYDARMEINGWLKVGGRLIPSPGNPGEGKGEGEMRSDASGVHSHTPSPPPSPSVLGEGVSAWRSVIVCDDPGILVVAHRAPPVKKIQTIKPIVPPIASANKRRHIFDMGQNMVGWVRLRLRDTAPGKTIDLRHVEMLDKDGKPYVAALRSARATDHYTTRGAAEEFCEPRFTFHGFRYVEVRDYPGGMPTVDDLTGIVVHSDTEPTGTFECSDPLINQLQHNIVWSQKGNFIDIPTDCPQRDERLGWTGDAQVFVRTAAFNMDVANFFEKWMTDVIDAQGDDGRIPSVVPHVPSIHGEGGPAWADAAVICPWAIYLSYGDKRILENCWPMMTRFLDFLINTSPGYVRADETKKWRGYGDWLSVDAYTPPDLIGTAFFAHCANLLSQIAGVLGKPADAAKFKSLSEDVKKVWLSRYVTPEGLIIAQTQTAYVLALHFDLLPERIRNTVAEALVRNIKSRGMHLSTGFVGTPYLNHVLTRFGHNEIAYALLMQKTFPSWLFPVTHGATTMWERWDGWTPEKGFNDAGMNSYNHYAYGAVGDWMYSTIAGIDFNPAAPGYKHIRIRPTIGGGLTWAKATLKSMYGLIESAWRVEGKTLRLDVTIPPNTTATIRMPTADAASVRESGGAAATITSDSEGSVQFDLGSGRYAFSAHL